MSNKTFTAQLDEFEKLTTANLRYVASQSVQDVMEAAQTPARGVSKGGSVQVGKIPVAEAELINSLSTDGGAPSADSYVVAIAGFEIGDSMSFSYTAPHAMIKEVGGNGQEGWHFVGVNARRFPEFVEARVKEVRK